MVSGSAPASPLIRTASWIFCWTLAAKIAVKAIRGKLPMRILMAPSVGRSGNKSVSTVLNAGYIGGAMAYHCADFGSHSVERKPRRALIWAAIGAASSKVL